MKDRYEHLRQWAKKALAIRWQKHKIPLADRFWKFVAKREPEKCWLWQGTHGGKKGRYGMFQIGKRGHLAHRMAYSLSKGDPGKLNVCHACDNVLCCNPAHLWLGTHKENMHDAIKKGRFVLPPPNCKGRQTIYSDDLVARLKEDYKHCSAKELAIRYSLRWNIVRYLVHNR